MDSSSSSLSSPTSSTAAVTSDPMDVDPIDDGPKQVPPPPPPPELKLKIPAAGLHVSTAGMMTVGNNGGSSGGMSIACQEEARQAIDMLRGDDVAGRVAAAHRLDAVAAVLGEERAREELLPFVTDGVDDEDEVLLAMSLSLGRMVDAVGGPDRAHALLRPLELLLSVEENAVREAAAASAVTVASALPAGAFERDCCAMVNRLAEKEWFTARISAAALTAAVYPKLQCIADDVNREEQCQLLLRHFAALCRDDTAMVRRVAAQHLGTMVENVVAVAGRSCLLAADGPVRTVLLPLYEEFASNEQPDSVRLQTTENCVAFGRVMSGVSTTSTSHEQGGGSAAVESASAAAAAAVRQLSESELALLQRVLPLIVATIDDRSWRVRWTAAAKFADVIRAYDALPAAAVSAAAVMDQLVPAYEKLLQDPEAEVRTAATFNLAAVAASRARVPVPPSPNNRPPAQDGSDHSNSAAGGAASDGGGAGTATVVDTTPRVSVAERLVKRVTSLTEDDSEHVRAALAMVATELAPILGKDATITYLVPPVLLLLRDAASEVRLNLISSLSSLNEVIGVDLLSQSLLPAILDLAQDGKWRIRLAIIRHMPLLAKQLGQDFFTEKLVSLCVGWLGDDIATIRHAAAGNLKELTALFGTKWATDYLIPSIVDIRRQDSYLRRLTALLACSMMAQEMDPDAVRIEVLPLVLDMAMDTVPNIRFNVAKELQTIAPVCGLHSYESQVLPVLTMLKDDDDRDVRFYAKRTTGSLEGHFANAAAATATATAATTAAAAAAAAAGTAS